MESSPQMVTVALLRGWPAVAVGTPTSRYRIGPPCTLIIANTGVTPDGR